MNSSLECYHSSLELDSPRTNPNLLEILNTASNKSSNVLAVQVDIKGVFTHASFPNSTSKYVESIAPLNRCKRNQRNEDHVAVGLWENRKGNSYATGSWCTFNQKTKLNFICEGKNKTPAPTTTTATSTTTKGATKL